MKFSNIYLTFLLVNSIASAKAGCSNTIDATTPNKNFEILSDSLVKDNDTRLMWMRCSVGQHINEGTCSGTILKLTWQEALQKASEANYAGYNDWRLPNKNELNSIVELSCNTPAINTSVFQSTGTFSYWTSSPYEYHEGLIWTVNFADGSIFASDGIEKLAIRFVRDF